MPTDSVYLPFKVIAITILLIIPIPFFITGQQSQP